MRDVDVASDEHESSRPATARQDGQNWSRRRTLGSLASAGTLALAGCSSLRSLTSGVQPRWERSFSSAAAAGPPAATDGHVAVGGQDKRLHGFTADGERILAAETGGPIEAKPAVPASGGPVHVHSTDGDLYTFGLSGEQLWHLEGRARDRGLGRRGSLLVGTDRFDDVITGYDASDGTRRFRQPGRAYPAPTLGEPACLVQARTTDDETELVALGPETGAVLWTTAPATGYRNVVAAGDRVVTVHSSTVRLRRTRDGEVLWRTAMNGDVISYVGPPVWLGESVYVCVRRDDRSDELVAIDRDGGATRWRRTVGYELERVASTADGVFVASSVNDPDGGILIRLDSFDLDGTRRWQTTTEVAIGGTVAALGRAGEVLFAASDGEVAAYDPATGRRRWRYDSDSSRIGLTATDDALYVSLRDRGGLIRLPTT